MHYYRSKTTGEVFVEAHMGLTGHLDLENLAAYERVTVKKWKPKRLKIGDRVVTTDHCLVGAGYAGVVIEDDRSTVPFEVRLGEVVVFDGECWTTVWGRADHFKREEKKR